ncbi:cysteine-rich repeat secretory protein 12 [Canna indica]|uniref:Cysteine-rich repeat secretory protein 12 n=1 Tax=Canna indica TaxID=4628 RepID=A0AAQ3QEN5_9LILI|nr:cysteine-rich repeat secretory protein 12 [Canna indica]
MSAIILLHLIVFSSIASRAASASDDLTGFVYAGCSQPKYTPGSPYQLNVDSLLSSIANDATYSSYANLTSAAAASSTPVDGLFQCRGDLPTTDCSSCVRSALSQLSSFCPFAAGAAVQLRGCFIRYGNDSFIGKPDTSLLFKKCGDPAAGGGYNSDQLGMRDAALAGLSTSGGGGSAGSYRVGAAGYVQAMAQCVGDQGGKQCDDCVAAAVAQLKAACGFAVAGDVYLGKCYARFWSNGNGGGSGGGGYNYNSNHYHGDEAGKTVAIIIGLIAGVALIIIFLSFLRRAGNYGKE